jgi:hypothetical protein
MKKVTPIIKRTRVHTERYDVCPHCRQEIYEKSTYVDDENYVYHRPCQEQGPIDILKPVKDFWIKLTAQAQGENMQFIKITIPLTNRTDIEMFKKVVNQGIDSHLEAFTKSRFSRGKGDVGEPRLILDFHVSELPLLVRRLNELGTEEAESWAQDIESQPEYKKTTPKVDNETDAVDEEVTTSRVKPTIVKMANGKFGLKIAKNDLNKVTMAVNGTKTTISKQAILALVAQHKPTAEELTLRHERSRSPMGTEVRKTLNMPISIFDLAKTWEDEGYGIALIDAQNNVAVDPYVDPNDYPTLMFTSAKDGAKSTDGKYYARFHSSILQEDKNHLNKSISA